MKGYQLGIGNQHVSLADFGLGYVWRGRRLWLQYRRRWWRAGLWRNPPARACRRNGRRRGLGACGLAGGGINWVVGAPAAGKQERKGSSNDDQRNQHGPPCR